MKSQLDVYIRTIGKTPLLTPEDEHTLAIQAREELDNEEAEKGKQKHPAVDRLVSANLRLVVSIAKKFRQPGVDFEDLIAAGNLGLYEAIRRFDPDRMIKLSTYATPWIQMRIRLWLRESHIIHIPHYLQDLLPKYQKAYAKLSKDDTAKPSAKELIAQLGDAKAYGKEVTESVIELIDHAAMLLRSDELNSPHSYLKATEKHKSAQEQEERTEEAVKALSLVKNLKERQRLVVEMRYGLNGQQYMLKDIAPLLGVTTERVRQIAAEALAELREKMEVEA